MAKKELTQGVLLKMSDEEKAQALLEDRIPEKMFGSTLIDFTTEPIKRVLLSSVKAARHLSAEMILGAFQDEECVKALTQDFMDALPKDTLEDLAKEFGSHDGLPALHNSPIAAVKFMKEKFSDEKLQADVESMISLHYSSNGGQNPVLTNMALAASAENNNDAARAVIWLADILKENIPDEFRAIWEVPELEQETVTSKEANETLSMGEGDFQQEEFSIENFMEEATNDTLELNFSDEIDNKDINMDISYDCIPNDSMLSEPEIDEYTEELQHDDQLLDDDNFTRPKDSHTDSGFIGTQDQTRTQSKVSESSHNIPKDSVPTHKESRIVQKAIVMESPKSFLEKFLDVILRIFGKKPVEKTATRYVNIVENVDIPNEPKRNAKKEIQRDEPELSRTTGKKARLQADMDQAGPADPVQPREKTTEYER